MNLPLPSKQLRRIPLVTAGLVTIVLQVGAGIAAEVFSTDTPASGMIKVRRQTTLFLDLDVLPKKVVGWLERILI